MKDPESALHAQVKAHACVYGSAQGRASACALAICSPERAHICLRKYAARGGKRLGKHARGSLHHACCPVLPPLPCARMVHSAERADVLACMQRADAVACMHAARSARRCVCESMYVEACFMQVVLRSLRSHVHAWRIAQPCCSVSDARARLHGCAGIPGR